MAKEHLKQQGINQWQAGYPDYDCIQQDIANKKGFFIVDGETVLGYLCIDFDGEPAYDTLNGKWQTGEKYVVVHRMAFTKSVRGRGISGFVLPLPLVMKYNRELEKYFTVVIWEQRGAAQENRIINLILPSRWMFFCRTLTHWPESC